MSQGNEVQGKEAEAWTASSVRNKRKPLIRRKVWILGADPGRIEKALLAINDSGHDARTGEPGSELASSTRCEW